MIVRIRTTPEAETHAGFADEWWRRNRQASPDLFASELAGACDLLVAAPEIGRRYRRKDIAGLRRLLLPATRYHVYYVFDRDAASIVILAIWSGVRGRTPQFRRP